MMSINRLRENFSLTASLKLIYNRATYSRATFTYFMIVLVYFSLQVVLLFPGLAIGKPQSPSPDAGQSADEHVELCSPIPGQTLTQIRIQAMNESRALVAFQAWLFTISLAAILFQCIPHLITSFAAHVLSTAWASFQMIRAEHIEERLAVIATNDVCGPLISTYLRARFNNQVLILLLDIIGLFTSIFLPLLLYEQYQARLHDRVHASPRIFRMYFLVLVFSAFLQLTVFFLVTTLTLWIGQFSNELISQMGKRGYIYYIAGTVMVVLIFPWWYTGWTAVRRARRGRMHLFLLISALLIAAQIGMLFLAVRRMVFTTWTFFATLSVTAYTLLFVTSVMGVICRVFLSKGLAELLEEPKSDTPPKRDLEAVHGPEIFNWRHWDPTRVPEHSEENAPPLNKKSPQNQSEMVIAEKLWLDFGSCYDIDFELAKQLSFEEKPTPSAVRSAVGDGKQPEVVVPRKVHFAEKYIISEIESISSSELTNISLSSESEYSCPASEMYREDHSESSTELNRPRSREITTREQQGHGAGHPGPVSPSAERPVLTLKIPQHAYSKVGLPESVRPAKRPHPAMVVTFPPYDSRVQEQ